MKGLVIKGIGGFYYVEVENQVYECKARGILKKDKNKVVVGDFVDIKIKDGEETVITEIYPRKNQFIRPPIANVDCFLVTLSVDEPNPSFLTIDKFLVMAEKSKTDVILCVTKVDLAEKDKGRKKLDEIREIYEPLYDIVYLSSKNKKSIEDLRTKIKGKTCAFAGASGVGKTSLINALAPDINLETGDISKKTLRGKHTTRHVEIFTIGDGNKIFDTPGFTSFQVMEADERELSMCFPEINKLVGKCKYSDCQHINEPNCAVLESLACGEISKSRYHSYVNYLKEITERNKKW